MEKDFQIFEIQHKGISRAKEALDLSGMGKYCRSLHAGVLKRRLQVKQEC
jgi:hypothetical protein